MFGWNQELTWKIVEIKPAEAQGFTEVTAVFNTTQGQQVFRVYVTPDQKFAVTGDMVPFGADPFAPARAELKAANGPSHGPADAAVTIVEFGDLECPACKAAQPNLTKLMEEEPKLKLIFQNFPLESLHKWALLGAKYVDCVSQQGNDIVFKFISTVYTHQGEITADTADAMLKDYAKEAGANADTVAACVAKPETEKPGSRVDCAGRKAGRQQHTDVFHQRTQGGRLRQQHPLRSGESHRGFQPVRCEIAGPVQAMRRSQTLRLFLARNELGSRRMSLS